MSADVLDKNRGKRHALWAFFAAPLGLSEALTLHTAVQEIDFGNAAPRELSLDTAVMQFEDSCDMAPLEELTPDAAVMQLKHICAMDAAPPELTLNAAMTQLEDSCDTVGPHELTLHATEWKGYICDMAPFGFTANICIAALELTLDAAM